MKINVTGIKSNCFIGILENEKLEKQKIEINLEFQLNINIIDEISQTFSYASVSEDIENLLNYTNHISLIETLNYKIAELFLSKYSILKTVWVEINKLEAPVNYEFQKISVSNEYSRQKCVLNFGSNIGNKLENINNAVNKLKRDYKVIKEMDHIETAPYGNKNLNIFINKTIVVEIFDIYLFHNYIKKLEQKTKNFWENRILDIDIILLEEKIIHTEDLTIPHYDMENRDFIINDVYKIYPRGIHPVLNKSWKEIQNKF